MVPAEKMQELDAVVNFWKSRIDALSAELGVLQDLRIRSRPGGDRYAADRLLREIKKKTADMADTRECLQRAERDLGEALESSGVLEPMHSHIHVPSYDHGQSAH